MKQLLKKWLDGSITWEEEKKLRQGAESDKFYAEALEGYDAFSEIDHSIKLQQLKSRLPKVTKKEKTTLYYLSRVAAAAAIIGVIGTFFWVQQAVEQPAILSQQAERIEVPMADIAEEVKEADTESDIVSIESNTVIAETDNPTKELETAAPKPAATITKKEKIVASKEEVLEKEEYSQEYEVSEVIAATDPTPIKDEAASIAEVPQLGSVQEEEQDLQDYTESAPIAAPTAPQTYQSPPMAQSANRNTRTSAVSKRKASAIKINYYAGSVQNEDGQPLSGVKIVGFGNDNPYKTTSQANGTFSLETTQQLSKLTLSKDGYHTRKISIDQYKDFLNISLEKQSTNVGAVGEELTPKPVEGFMNFFDYVKENLIYPEEAKLKRIEREVKIEFYINQDGVPTNLKVINPDKYGFDKEAIRLLETGPKWEPVNSPAQYFVSFKFE